MERFTFPIISPHLADAIYNTLLHSMWYGALLAIAAGLVLSLTKISAPSVRYNILVCLLFAFYFSLAWTFISNLNSVEESGSIPARSILTRSSGNFTWQLLFVISVWLKTYETWVLLFWLSCVFLKSIRFSFGFHWMKRLKATTWPVPTQWNNRVKNLRSLFRINQTVQLLQSGTIQVPLVLGYFKPIIILPIGLLAALPADQVEAILLHELAHIYRKDYLINFLQNLLEVLLFFNPGLLWVSKMIRREREHCCDDIAVKFTKKPVNYMHALVSFREFQIETKAMSLSFSGHSNLVIERLRRLSTGQNTILTGVEKSFLALTFVTALAFALVLGPSSEKTNNLSDTKNSVHQLVEKRKAEALIPSLLQDLINDRIITNRSELSYKLSKSEMVVNNQKQPEAIHQKYRIKYIGNSGGTIMQNN